MKKLKRSKPYQVKKQNNKKFEITPHHYNDDYLEINLRVRVQDDLVNLINTTEGVDHAYKGDNYKVVARCAKMFTKDKIKKNLSAALIKYLEK